MTEELYLTDPYLREFTARVVRLSGREVVLDRTAFYPGGGGMPPDKGELRAGPIRAAVIEVRRAAPEYDYDDYEDDHEDPDDEDSGEESGAGIVHVLGRAIPGTVRLVRCALDWERRHRNLRYATALALTSAVARREFGLGASGGRIRASRARLDLEKSAKGRPVDERSVRALERAVNAAILSGGRVGVEGGRLRVADLPPVEAGGLYVREAGEVGRVGIPVWTDRGGSVRLELKLEGDGEVEGTGR